MAELDTLAPAEPQGPIAPAEKDSSGTDTDDAGIFLNQVKTDQPGAAAPAVRTSGRVRTAKVLPDSEDPDTIFPELSRKRGPRKAQGSTFSLANKDAARRAGIISISDLIENGVIIPGPNALRSDYKNVADFADVLPDGRIRQGNRIFDSPSAFSIYSKRKLTPARKSDDGWKSLKYMDKPLEHWKNMLVQKYKAMPPELTGFAPYVPSAVPAFDRPNKRRRLDEPLPPLGGLAPQELPPLPAAAPGAPNSDASAKKGSLPAFAGGLPPMHLSMPGELALTNGAAAPMPPPFAAAAPPAPIAKRPQPVPIFAPPVPVETILMRPPPVPKPPKPSAKAVDCVHAANPVARPPKVAEAAKDASAGAAPAAAPAVNRARRCVKPRRFGAMQHADHNMVQLEQYKQLPGSSLPDAQPFKIAVHPVALVAMDIHAHLCQHEVIGVLGGKYNRELGTIDIYQARCVKELIVDSDANINVEMDPVDQQRVVQELHACNLQCVGWYHSHPTFPALPSGIDVLNQVMHQMHHRTADGNPAPYIAAIVGPYHQKNNGLQSKLTWFYVERDEDEPNGGSNPTGMSGDELLSTCLPRALQVDAMKGAHLSSMEIFNLVGPLVTKYATYSARTNFAEPWREKTTHLQKMVASMYTWCLGHLSAEDMYDVGRRIIDFAWRAFYPDYCDGIKPAAIAPGTGWVPSQPNTIMRATPADNTAATESVEADDNADRPMVAAVSEML